MNVSLSSPSSLAGSQHDVVRRATALIPRVRAEQAASDEQARVPPQLTEELQEAGLFSLAVPKQYGGLQTSLTTWMEAVTEIGRGAGGIAWAVTLTNACAWSLSSLFPHHVIDEVYAKPNTRISGVFSWREMKARRVSGGIQIDRGFWMFNSGVNLVQWDLLGVPLLDENNEQTGRGIAVVPISQVKIHNDWDTIGLRASGSCSVSVEDVFIPDERIVPLKAAVDGTTTDGLREHPLYRSAFMPLTLVVLNFPVLGLGMHMIEETLNRLPTSRIVYTAYTKQAEAPVTHLQMAESSAKVEAAKLMVAKCCSEIEHWADGNEIMPVMDRARSRLFVGAADKFVWEAVDLLASAAGGSLARRTNLLNRIWQDVKVAGMHGMAAPMTNFELYGRMLCGMDANSMNV